MEMEENKTPNYAEWKKDTAKHKWKKIMVWPSNKVAVFTHDQRWKWQNICSLEMVEKDKTLCEQRKEIDSQAFKFMR